MLVTSLGILMLCRKHVVLLCVLGVRSGFRRVLSVIFLFCFFLCELLEMEAEVEFCPQLD